MAAGGGRHLRSNGSKMMWTGDRSGGGAASRHLSLFASAPGVLVSCHDVTDPRASREFLVRPFNHHASIRT